LEFVSALWACPFLGIIFSVSFLPLLCSGFWNRYASRVLLFWPIVYLLLVVHQFGPNKAIFAVFDSITADYIPFIVLIASLYIVSGGIFIDFPQKCSAFFNTLVLFFGSLIAGWIGTTGAAVLLIRPLLRANEERKYKTHLVVFFIFLVANIGGGSSPLGDPPLFIGFLNGIDFFWFIKNLYPFLIGAIIALCLLFFIIDFALLKIDRAAILEETKRPIVIFQGMENLIVVELIVLTVILCNFKGGFSLGGEKFHYSSVLRNILLAIITWVSLKITPHEIRQKNCFSFAPIREVSELFIGVFITIAPIIYILQQGKNGAFRCIFEWIAPNGEVLANRCFWASGLLSSILDNAPTFLVFFHLTSGDANALMSAKANVLTAFSISVVFMGALTYIGNAPNLMVKSISEGYGVKVPSFLGYLLWSCAILLPIFLIISHFGIG
jgi:Na+/H+ antiporter NhaD/arsenite permease-like protein